MTHSICRRERPKFWPWHFDIEKKSRILYNREKPVFHTNIHMKSHSPVSSLALAALVSVTVSVGTNSLYIRAQTSPSGDTSTSQSAPTQETTPAPSPTPEPTPTPAPTPEPTPEP